jgi:hypothetical protein
MLQNLLRFFNHSQQHYATRQYPPFCVVTPESPLETACAVSPIGIKASMSGSLTPTTKSTTNIINPYLHFFSSLPPSYWRNPNSNIDNCELWSQEWLRLKSTIASHFSWAVPTQRSIDAIKRYTDRVIEIGCGSGYWAWLMEQAGIDVIAFDAMLPPFAWYTVHLGNEVEVLLHSDRTLFLCWPPWNSEMASNSLSFYKGSCIIYVGEWMGGCASPKFFWLLNMHFEAVETIAIPQWFMRTDSVSIFLRRHRNIEREEMDYRKSNKPITSKTIKE